MTKRRISKASKRRLTFFGTISLLVIIYFCFSVLYNAYNIFSLSLEKRNLENEYISLQEKAEDLKRDIEKLNDEEYLANYARETYLYSKSDEYIIQLNEDSIETKEGLDIISNTINAITNLINKDYAILGLSFLMALIFIYILLKGKRYNKSKK